ncbi:hypothetical protein P8452_25759 [Trifolium repens]|nr:hypothetical protein P8452_25759 [Trifolium repens]
MFLHQNLFIVLVVCLHQKLKRVSESSSSGGVIDTSFSCDSSNDSWTVASSDSLSLQPMFKRSRAQDQQMRLPFVNRVCIDCTPTRSVLKMRTYIMEFNPSDVEINIRRDFTGSLKCQPRKKD